MAANWASVGGSNWYPEDGLIPVDTSLAYRFFAHQEPVAPRNFTILDSGYHTVAANSVYALIIDIPAARQQGGIVIDAYRVMLSGETHSGAAPGYNQCSFDLYTVGSAYSAGTIEVGAYYMPAAAPANPKGTLFDTGWVDLRPSSWRSEPDSNMSPVDYPITQVWFDPTSYNAFTGTASWQLAYHIEGGA